VMKKTDIVSRQQQERDEWRQGVGGIVKSVDAGANTITVANALAAGGKTISVQVPQGTQILRYAPDSIKFDDARPGTFDQIKPGDQLRARGTKNADGTELTAQAVVSGTFRDIAGTVTATDAASNTITVMDLTTKKPVAIKLSGDTQLRKLPQFVAMGIATRLKGGTPGAPGQGATGDQSGSQGGGNWGGSQGQGQWRRPGDSSGAPGNAGAGGAGGGSWRSGANGPPDFQQMLSRMPSVSITDLNKGDAVMLVATEGT